MLQKRSQMLVDSIDQIHETNLILEDKDAKTQETLIYKQFRIFQKQRRRNQWHPRILVGAI
jgi:hypothetical protein